MRCHIGQKNGSLNGKGTNYGNWCSFSKASFILWIPQSQITMKKKKETTQEPRHLYKYQINKSKNKIIYYIIIGMIIMENSGKRNRW